MRLKLPASAMILTALVFGAGCGTPQAINDQLFLQAGNAVSVIRAGATAPVFRSAFAVPSRDWSTVVRTRWQRGSTRVSAFIPSSGTKLWSQTTDYRLRTKVVSENGNLAVLGPLYERAYTSGRKETQLVIAGRKKSTQYMTLQGNYEPEAFSLDGKNLFVLHYRPARAPTSYQVQRLDLTTGKVHDVYTPDEHRQEAMRGDARVQAVSNDGRRLYTLYTVQSPHGMHAFIHVLSLDELWAHCIDLPESFALGARHSALSVSPKGDKVYVANPHARAVAEVDAASLAVTRTADIDYGTANESHAVYAADGTLYLGSGPFLSAVDVGSLREKDSWVMGNRIKGIQLGEDGHHVYVGLSDRVVVLEVATGRAVKTLNPPGVRRIGRLGRVIKTINPIPKAFSCAC
jgi:DNA-binding beta-propeller fold protein YncE